MPPARPRVGLLVPRFTVFDGALGAERVDRLRRRGELLARAIEDESDATPARRAFNDARIECGTASAVRYAPRTGPATLIGMSAAADGWRLSWLEGAAASSRISAGVTHHPVLVPGRVGETLALVARALGAKAIAA